MKKLCNATLYLFQEKYLQQLLELVPDYGSEHYSVQVDEGGKIYKVSLVVNPSHPEYPGLRMRVENSKNVSYVFLL